MRTAVIIFWLLGLLLHFDSPAQADEVCLYLDNYGKVRTTSNRAYVPAKYREQAQCGQAKGSNHLAKPDQIELDGNIREESFASPVGTIKLRWPRTAEQVFGRNPKKAVIEAARVVSRVLSRAAFPVEFQQLNLEWNIVFMDENLPSSQIPSRLISNCHPGWMTPPANIYIVAQRIAAGCGGKKSTASVADAELARVLIHEFGHAVEYYMLKEHFGGDRMRAEGFATFFTRFAGESSSMLNSSEIKREDFALASHSLKLSPDSFVFMGDAASYARASIYFSAIVERRGIRGLMKVYQAITEQNLGFFDAVEKALMWDKPLLEKEVRRVLEAS